MVDNFEDRFGSDEEASDQNNHRPKSTPDAIAVPTSQERPETYRGPGSRTTHLPQPHSLNDKSETDKVFTRHDRGNCSGAHLPHYPVSFASPCPISFGTADARIGISVDHRTRLHHFSHAVGRNSTQAEAESLAEHYSRMARNYSRGKQLGFYGGLGYAWFSRKWPNRFFDFVRWNLLRPELLCNFCSLPYRRYWATIMAFQSGRALLWGRFGKYLRLQVAEDCNHDVERRRMLKDKRLGEYCDIFLRKNKPRAGA